VKLFFLGLKPSTMSVALSLVLISGCVTTKPDPEPWSADKNLVIQSLQDAHVDNAKLKEHLDTLEKRILDLERLNAEQQTKIVVLEAAVKKRKQASIQKKRPSKAKKAKALNQRLDALAASTPLPAKPVVVKTNTVIGKAKKENADEKNAYTAAYLALKSGRYDEASAGFVKVIKAHPKGEYTDQAYYWLGESLVALLRNPEALESFTVVANQYPKSTKHAAALMKMAAVYKSMKYYDQARLTLKQVIKEYPDGRTAERARAELKVLPSTQDSSGVKK
jgi:tol-pal system protein YbgF